MKMSRTIPSKGEVDQNVELETETESLGVYYHMAPRELEELLSKEVPAKAQRAACFKFFPRFGFFPHISIIKPRIYPINQV